MAIECKCPEHLAAIRDHARARGLLDQFEDRLGFIERLPGRVVLFKDFAPYSLYWEVDNGRGRVMNGGLIYYGPTDTSGVGAPQFSCRLGGDDGEGWELHT